MFKIFKNCSKIAIYYIALYSFNASGNALNELDVFLKTTKSGSTNFTQTVTPPPRAEQGAAQKPRVKTSNGVFEFVRPDRFRFSYQKPFEQLIVADGKQLWLYDVDLKQVTERKQAQVLQSTPAALIIGAASLDALRAQYHLTNAPDADGLAWAQAVPKSSDGQIQRIRIGFQAGLQGSSLAALEFLDSFGQTSRLQFTDLKLNLPLGAERFSFVPPAGVSVARP